MKIYFNSYFLCLIIVVSIFLYLVHTTNLIKENWETYRTPLYGTVSSGSSPLSFYPKPQYRLPFGYPYRYLSTYPMRQLRFSPPS